MMVVILDIFDRIPTYTNHLAEIMGDRTNHIRFIRSGVTIGGFPSWEPMETRGPSLQVAEELGADVVNHGTLWLCQNSDIENGPVEIVDLPIKIAWWFSSSFFDSLPEGKPIVFWCSVAGYGGPTFVGVAKIRYPYGPTSSDHLGLQFWHHSHFSRFGFISVISTVSTKSQLNKMGRWSEGTQSFLDPDQIYGGFQSHGGTPKSSKSWMTMT